MPARAPASTLGSVGGHGPIQRRVGHVVTRLMMWKPLRRSRLGRSAYGWMYLFGKAHAERAESEFFRRLVRPGETVVDLGANVGFYTAQFSEIVGDRGFVLAFEPDPFCADILRRRIGALASARNVRIEDAALGAAPGEAVLYCSHRDRAETRTHPLDPETPGETVRVPVRTLDEYCREHGIGRIDGLKVDVEGDEVGVLKGMREILTTRPPAWIFIEFSPDQLRGAGDTPEAFWSLLRAHGYRSYALENGRPAGAIEDTDAFTRAHLHEDSNVLAVHRSRSSGAPPP